MRVKPSERQCKELLEDYQKLPAFPEVDDALLTLGAENHRLASFSNGPEKSLEPLLKLNGLLDCFDLLVSMHDKQTFKPNPATYAYLHERPGGALENTWVVSSNPFDIIGAKRAGLRAAWLKRDEDKTFDPWEIEPDFIAADLSACVEWIKV